MEYLMIHPDVQNALNNNKPVVALESTIIAHGMPYPTNVEVALECEKIIRDHGAIPATIAIINGIIKIGLTVEEIELLAQGNAVVHKTSRRDIPYVVSKKLTGALTVSGTMICAHMAGIKVFATGGIGGVHRGAESTFDISADLVELAQTDVCVVSAGMKSILDLPKTVEYLETAGVPVIGYRTDYLPAFYTRESSIKLQLRLDTPEEIASLLKTKWDVGLKGGVVVANPIPKAASFPSEWMEAAIEEATKQMNEQSIIGKDSTPFLLKKITELTQGQSLDANIALVYNNCVLASKISCSLATMEEKS